VMFPHVRIHDGTGNSVSRHFFLLALSFLRNDEGNSIKCGSPDNKLSRQRAPVGNAIQ
jgi:hypothetical protein